MRFTFLLLFLLSFSFALTNISNCTDLTIAGETYQLNTSFSATRDICLNITTTETILKGQNFTITSNGYDLAILAQNGSQIENLTLVNYSSGIRFENTSSFSYITFKDSNKSFSNNVSSVLLSSDNIPFNASHITISNISLLTARPAIGLLAKGRTIGGKIINITNSNIDHITFINSASNYQNFNGSGEGCASIGLIALSGDGFTETKLNINNSNFTNIYFNNLTSISTIASSSGLFSTCAAVPAAESTPAEIKNIHIENISLNNVTTQLNGIRESATSGLFSYALGLGDTTLLSFNNISIKNLSISNVSSNRVEGIFAYGGDNTGFGSFITNISLTNISFIQNFSTNPISLAFLNFSGIVNTVNSNSNILFNLTYSSNQSTAYEINTTSLIATIKDFSTIRYDPLNATNESSYLNYTILGHYNITLYYITPQSPALEQNTFLWTENGSAWIKIAQPYLIDIINKKVIFNQTLNSTNNFGLFADYPATNVTLLYPLGTQFPRTTTNITFNWTCTGSFASYATNLSVNGQIYNFTTLNNTIQTTSLILSPNEYIWSITCYNQTAITSSSSTFSSNTFSAGGSLPNTQPPAPPPTPTPTQPTPTPTQPTFSNPPSTSGYAKIADSIAESLNLKELPYSCAPWFEKIPFFGKLPFGKIFDIFICEYKGILSLYSEASSIFINVFLIILILLFILLTRTNKEKTPRFFWGITIIFITTVVIGFDFLTFMASVSILTILKVLRNGI